jgi:hypothetical protein
LFAGRAQVPTLPSILDLARPLPTGRSWPQRYTLTSATAQGRVSSRVRVHRTKRIGLCGVPIVVIWPMPCAVRTCRARILGSGV